jgi:hypothetical protein
MPRSQAEIGDVVQVLLPGATYAYGRVLRDGSVAFYSTRTVEARRPPIGSRDYQFTVGVYADLVGSKRMPIVGHDPSRNADDEWPPPGSVRDPISGKYQLYHRGQMRPATDVECRDLEPVAAWDYEHVIDRLQGGTRFTGGFHQG